MNLHSVIKRTILVFVLVLNYSLNAQIKDQQREEFSEEKNETTLNSKQRNLAYSLGYHNPIPTGDNFIGEGLEGNGGFSFKVQAFVYRQFFIGGSVGASYFDVKNPLVVGNYKKTSVAEQFLFIGYEFVPTEKFRVGLTASILGDSRYKNQKTDDVYQKDSAKLNSYGTYFSYEVSNGFMIYLDYAYRIDKTKIAVPAALENTFRRGKFHQIGIGLKFSLKGKALISSF